MIKIMSEPHTIDDKPIDYRIYQRLQEGQWKAFYAGWKAACECINTGYAGATYTAFKEWLGDKK